MFKTSKIVYNSIYLLKQDKIKKTVFGRHVVFKSDLSNTQNALDITETDQKSIIAINYFNL